MTKRKNYRIDPNDRFRPPNPKLNFNLTAPNSPSRKDIDSHKKVKFAALEKGSSRSRRLEDSNRPEQREKVKTCADTDPKTSEYAFFKKVKKDAGLGVRSHPLHKDDDQSKKPESSDYSRERTGDVRVGNKGFNFSRIIKDASTVKTDSFVSPSDGAWNKSDTYSMSSMQKSSRGCGDAVEPQGNQCMQGEIFSRKRHKLRQCVADAVFPDMDKLCSKGHDIVSMLLSRLFPSSIQENKYEDPNPGKVMDATSGYDLINSRESDARFDENHRIPTRKLLELESSSYFSDQLLSPMFLKSDERIAPHAEFANPGKVVNATSGYDLLDSRELDGQFKEHHQLPINKLLELESNSYFSDQLLSPMFLKSDERIAPHAEFANPVKVVNATSGYDLLDSRELDGQFKEHHLLPMNKPLELESNSYFSDQLLSPMFLKSDERIAPHAEFANPVKVVNATSGYDLLDSREMDGQFKEHHQLPMNKLLELESNSYFSNHLLSPMFLRADERITPHAEFPASHFHKFQPLYSLTEPESKFGGNPSFSFLSSEVLNATRYGLLDSRESAVRSKEHHQIPQTELQLESNSYFKDHLVSPIFLRSNERIIPHVDFPTSHSRKFQPLHSITEMESEFDGAPSFSAKSDPTLGFLLNEQDYEIFTSSYFKDLGKLKRAPIPLLLEKDFECTTDEINLPISYKYAKSDTVPALSTLGNGEDRMLKNILGEYHFRPSSLLLDKPQPEEFHAMLDSGLLRYQEFRYGKYVHENQDGMDMNLIDSAMSLSCNKHHFNLSEDCKNDIDTSFVQDSFYLPPYQHWIRRVSNDYHHYHPDDTEAWLKSSLDFISGRRCLSLSSSHSNYQSSNSSTLQLPQRGSMSSLHNSYDDYEPEMDGGNHREVLYHFREDLIGIYNSSFLRMSMQSDNGCTFPVDNSDYINEQEQTHKILL